MCYPTWSPSRISWWKENGEKEEEDDKEGGEGGHDDRTERKHVNSYSMDTAM